MRFASINSTPSIIWGLVLSTLFVLVPQAGHALELTFEFEVAIDGVVSDSYQFGLREDALQGLDNYDVAEPPASPNASFVSYLAMFNAPPTLPNRWRHDFRPTVNLLADRIELWQFDLQSDAIGEEATITIDAVGSVPVPYELYFFGPGVYYDPIQVPQSITFIIESNKLVYFWELRLADEVSDVSTTWGEVKSLFR